MIKPMKDETTHEEIFGAIQEVLETVNTFATHVDSEFFAVKERLDHIEFELSGVQSELGNVKSKVNTLPTKDYLDDKLSDQKAQILKIVQLKHFAR